MNYIGMDTHITNLDFAVVNEAGRLIKAKSVATSVINFMEFVRGVNPPRTIYMEEGTLAAWALEVCVRFREKLVITDPKRNHWISSSEQKEDPLDALKLAQLARGGFIKEIHHPVGERRRFRELMEAYHDTVRMTVPAISRVMPFNTLLRPSRQILSTSLPSPFSTPLPRRCLARRRICGRPR